jgi:AMMECR1 domain-containing protein
LLPQVAVEHHLDRERFLEETCHKAGFSRDAWKDPETSIYGFTCEILHPQN